jgi:hypothetical protein
MELFRKLFAGAKKAGSGGRTFRPVLESLESRDVPSFGPWFGAAHELALANLSRAGSALAGPTGGHHGGDSDSQAQTLSATLTGTSGASGNVSFSSNSASGQNHRRVSVSGLTADTAYTVSSGTTTLGTITTDANGNGKLSVRNVSPALTSGSDVTVTDPSGATVLSGTLAANSRQAGTSLIATLGGTGGGDGIAFAHTSGTSGQNSLRLFLLGLTPSSTYTVQLDGTTVGTVTTDANGLGQLSLSNLSTPPAAGSVLSVLDSTGATVLQGSFTSADFGLFGHWHHH